MPVAAGFGSDEARKLHDKMEECDRIIAADSEEVATYMKLSFDVSQVSTRTTNLHDLIGPAIKVLQANEGTWTAIAADIASIQKTVDSGKKIPLSFMAAKDVTRALHQWDVVKTLGEFILPSSYHIR